MPENGRAALNVFKEKYHKNIRTFLLDIPYHWDMSNYGVSQTVHAYLVPVNDLGVLKVYARDPVEAGIIAQLILDNIRLDRKVN